MRASEFLNEDLNKEFNLIESNIMMLAERNGVDADTIWEDLESLSDDELYVFAVTIPIMESQDVAEGRAITQAADMSTGAKKLWQYINRNLVDLASMASFYADRNETYIEERLANLLKTPNGQPIQIAFDMSPKIEFEKGTLYIPVGVMERYRGMYTSSRFVDDVINAVESQQGVAEGLEQTPDQVRQTLNAWMNQDQQYEDPSQRAGFQAKVWPYIQQNIKTILADKGEKGNGDYPAAPYAAWLLVQHMDAYPQNQIEFYNALKQALPNHPKIQFLRDRSAVNQWIMKNANNPKYFIKGKALPNPTVNVRNPAMFKDAGIVATSRKEALANAKQARNKLLVAAVNATNAQTQPSYKQSANENFADGKILDEQGVAEGSLEEIDRRGFLKGVGAAAVAGAAGGAKAAQEPIKQLQQRCNQIFDSVRKTSSDLMATRLQNSSDQQKAAQWIDGFNNIISSFKVVVKPDMIVFGKGPAYVAQDSGYRVITLDSEVWDQAPAEALTWAIAHEYGHCLDHNVFHATAKNPSQREQWADNIANSICKAMGITKSNALSVAYRNMRSTYDKENDPEYSRNKLQRLTDPGNHPTVHQRIQQAKKQGIELSKAQQQGPAQGVAEDWQKANKRDRTDGMSRKAVKTYRREHPGSKLQTAVTTKPSKLKKGSKASKRRKSYCSRSRGQMKMHNISCAKTPDKAICKARRRWNC